MRAMNTYYLHDAVCIYRFHRSDSVTINSFKRPLCIMKGYAMTAELILQKIAEKNAQASANSANSAEPKFRVNDTHIASAEIGRASCRERV